jgi:regulator of protease activity HflC (stomatin/prohibitin superfamily)
MTNNRYLIDNFEIVRPPVLLDKGLPLPGLSGKYVVEEGCVAVITVGGNYKEILNPGTHSLRRYSMWREVRAINVDMRMHTLTVSTSREFTIDQPVQVQIDLDLAVEYRVCDPRKVALELQTPLINLYDRVLQAVRDVIVRATRDEIRTRGENLARTTLQRLQEMQLSKQIGIEVLNVLVTTIKVLDTAGDVIATQQLKEFETIRDWQTDSAITQNSQLTWEWLVRSRPEIAQQLIAIYGEMAREMIDKGWLDPARLLNQPVGKNTVVPPDLLEFGLPGITPWSRISQQSELSGATTPGATITGSNDIHARMREEIRLLKNLPGAKVEARPGTNEDGSYNVRVQIPRNSGGVLTFYFACLKEYPQQAPVLEVEVDEQPTPYQSEVLSRWSGHQYLVEIVRDLQHRFG